ncbi:methylenetetrahydrofolate reductase [NAD(P)H] [Litoreibacter roseus]|uniref:Methylenetetrahydrofolate reductase n=1 Tax=Litoreibacter roseus TaxID=2601869 RepID=A0A6N6JBE8_9RHOB|nr:methylenetetrahydrofolate reductase [NAD(P)H] [Litoreibacter roseus]GFE63456.1 methylenetetrahydrofolate reductase [Litoreibacter roseus]
MTKPAISFEFFPPRNVEASFKLSDAVQTLAPLEPEFVSVTYGAGGTTRQLTHEAVEAIQKSSELTVAAHLTCVDASRDETLEVARAYKKAGVSDIVALRGDPPKGTDTFTPHKDGFTSSVELIEALKETGDFTIRVGAYPDIHPDAQDMSADIAYLKRKLDAGADAAITQFFFEADTFFRFRDACVAAGIDKPILPGILPIENWTSARRFAERCGTKIPGWLDDAYTAAQRDDREDLLSIAIASELCADLVEGGVEHLHFYTLNRPELTRDICTALGITQRTSLSQVA